MLRLASASPRRKMLLKESGFVFRYTPSDFKEQMHTKISATALARFNAEGKVLHAACKSGIVLGADTIIYFGKRVIGKPAGRRQAADILRSFSGKPHQVITGVAVRNVSNGKLQSFSVSTQVTFKKISEADIQSYLNTGEYKDKAGAYGYQSTGRRLIHSIKGSATNVIGLPMEETMRTLKEFGITPGR